MTRCDYAGCPSEAAHSDTCIHDERIATWYFCAWHIHDHRNEWYDTPLPERPELKPEREFKPCGTPAAYRRHLRRGETVCAACSAARRQQWHEKKAA